MADMRSGEHLTLFPIYLSLFVVSTLCLCLRQPRTQALFSKPQAYLWSQASAERREPGYEVVSSCAFADCTTYTGNVNSR